MKENFKRNSKTIPKSNNNVIRKLIDFLEKNITQPSIYIYFDNML